MISLLEIGEEKDKPKKKIAFPRYFAFFCALGIISIGTTLASVINLNSNGRTEFGQGIVAITRCDNSINVTPINSFWNSPGSGKFTFNGIQLDNISGNCAGKDLVIRVYDENGVPLPLTSNTENPVTEIRVYFQPMYELLSIAERIDGQDRTPDTVDFGGYWAEQFTLEGPETTLINAYAIGDLENLKEDPANGDVALEYFRIHPIENSVQIDFDPSEPFAAGFKDSRNVYKITIESKEHVS